MKFLFSFVMLSATLLLANGAEAYPHFQFSSDTSTCSACHYAPAGGGMLTGWGREEAADTLSRGGNGDVLHGLFELPESFDLAGDYRGAMLAQDTGKPEGGKLLFFPMQADVSARLSFDGLSFAGTVGLRGRARSSTPPKGSAREDGGVLSYIVSREHYLAYRAEGSGMTYRVGRFYAPYGLRLPDHTSYTRRYLGFNLLKETYNLSISRVGAKSESHVSAHVSDPGLGSKSPTFGGTAMHEVRGESHALGGNLRVTKGPSELKGLVGAHYKRWLAGSKVLFMAELDAGYQKFDEAGSSRYQLAAYVGPVWFPTQGVSASLAYELFDEDLLVKHVERQALTSWISILPRAHYEIFFLGRAARIGPKERVLTAMMQVHYYL